MFTVADRNRVRERVLALAAADARVVAGAVVGSLALDEGDRWSDLDLTFAVADGVPVSDVLEGWTRILVDEFDAIHLFDLPSGASIYRVFLLPGCLQCDLSFTPAVAFGATGPKFRLLFGSAVAKPFTPARSAGTMFGYAVHHALRTRFCIARGRVWQAEYWLGELRNEVLSLACLHHGLPTSHGRGFDALPADTRESFVGTIVGSLEPEELLRALGAVVSGLLAVSAEVRDLREMTAQVEPQLRDLMSSWGDA